MLPRRGTGSASFRSRSSGSNSSPEDKQDATKKMISRGGKTQTTNRTTRAIPFTKSSMPKANGNQSKKDANKQNGRRSTSGKAETKHMEVTKGAKTTRRPQTNRVSSEMISQDDADNSAPTKFFESSREDPAQRAPTEFQGQPHDVRGNLTKPPEHSNEVPDNRTPIKFFAASTDHLQHHPRPMRRTTSLPATPVDI